MSALDAGRLTTCMLPTTAESTLRLNKVAVSVAAKKPIAAVPPTCTSWEAMRICRRSNLSASTPLCGPSRSCGMKVKK